MMNGTHKSPFIGISSFEEENKDFFFGRSREIELVSFSILSNKITVLTGLPGVGKSSLIKAGVIPFLKKYNENNIHIQYHSSWTSITDLEISKYQTNIDNSPNIIILDQLDELLSNTQLIDEAQSFLHNLFLNTKINQYILLSIREDALVILKKISDILYNPISFSSIIRLQSFNPEQATQVIVESINQFNKGTIEQNQYIIDQDAVHKIIDMFVDPPKNNISSYSKSDQSIMPSQLQLYLSEIWSRVDKKDRRITSYFISKIGPPETILENYVGKRLKSIPFSHRNYSLNLIRYFCTTKNHKIQLTIDDLHSFTNYPTDLIQKSLDYLISDDIKLIRKISTCNSSEYIYQLYHDTLLDPLKYKISKENARRDKFNKISTVSFPIVLLLIILGFLGFYVYEIRPTLIEDDYTEQINHHREAGHYSMVPATRIKYINFLLGQNNKTPKILHAYDNLVDDYILIGDTHSAFNSAVAGISYYINNHSRIIFNYTYEFQYLPRLIDHYVRIGKTDKISVDVDLISKAIKSMEGLNRNDQELKIAILDMKLALSSVMDPNSFNFPILENRVELESHITNGFDRYNYSVRELANAYIKNKEYSNAKNLLKKAMERNKAYYGELSPNYTDLLKDYDNLEEHIKTEAKYHDFKEK